MNQVNSGLAAQMQVDSLCDEFESLFKLGAHPRIEDFLEKVDPGTRGNLILELVNLEIGLLQGQGARLSTEPLMARYSSLVVGLSDGETVLRSAIERALAKTEARQPDMAATVAHTGTSQALDSGFPIVDGFTIESVLGRGGMGVVYKAIQQFPRRPVALKMILDQRLAGDSGDREFLDRFTREAQAAADLNAPHFVQIYAFGECRGRPYMALEFVAGGSLEAFRKGEPQSIEFSAEMVEYLARGMEKSHRAGLVHRDLKPHNVLLTPDGVAKITDFGLVKRLDHDGQVTEDGRPLGTPSYMAPEQTYGTSEVGPPADIYALGGILYCLLTGRPPFQAANWRDTFDQVCHQDPVPPSRLNPRVSRDLETICLKCLQKDPSRRYASAQDLADDLKRFLEGRPIVARPVSRGEQAWRWARRNPWLAGLSATVAVLLVTVATVSSTMWWLLAMRNDTILSQNRELKSKGLVISHQNDELLSKNEELIVARDVTQEQRDASLEVVRNVLLRVDDVVRDDPVLFRLRAGIIAEALKGLDVVRDKVEQHPLADAREPLVARTEAIAYQRMGDMYLTGNRVSDAVKEFERGYRVLDQLYQVNPQEPANVRNLANLNNRLGDVELRLGNTLKARERYQVALELREKWSKLVPDHMDARRAIAESYALLGKVDLMAGDPASALENYQSVKEILNQLPDPPGAADAIPLRRDRASTDFRLADAKLQCGQDAEAEKTYQAALEERRKLAADTKNNPSIMHDVALSHMGLGNYYLLAKSDPGKAWEQYTEALKIFLAFYAGRPTGYVNRRDYAAVQYRMGATFRRARDQKRLLPTGQEAPDPASHFEVARKIRAEVAKIDDQDVQAKIEWAMAEARCGQFAKAEEIANRLEPEANSRKDPYVLFQLACVFALASESTDETARSRCTERAFKTLESLLASGWKDRVALTNDPDLDPLRKDPRFEKLLSSAQDR